MFISNDDRDIPFLLRFRPGDRVLTVIRNEIGRLVYDAWNQATAMDSIGLRRPSSAGRRVR